MKARINYAKTAPGVYDAMDSLEQYLQNCGLPESLLHLPDCEPRKSTDALTVWICTGRTCAR
jgi:hypothetical protein